VLSSALSDPDWPIRLGAFEELRRLTTSVGAVLPWQAVERGFAVGGRAFLFANQSKGIFRPAGMRGAALSVKTTVPRAGLRKYEDIAQDGGFGYAFQRRGADYHDNKLLLLAAEMRVPLIYFFGVAPGHYRPIWPMYVAEVDRARSRVILVADAPGELLEPGHMVADGAMAVAVRRYATIEVKKRLHQDVFRHIVLRAYQERCAVCQLPRTELLDAAHIEPDCDVRGEPSINNGLALCKLHHGAYDADLLGVRPDYVIELSSVLLQTRDGPTLEHALKAFAGRKISVPLRRVHQPAAAHLQARYELFLKAG
jgi:putative restriction endonuclease